MGQDCLAYKSYWFSVSCKVGSPTGSRNIKPEVVFKVRKMARYSSFCLIMGPFKGDCLFLPVVCAETPSHSFGPGNIRVKVRISFTTVAVRWPS